MCYCNIFSYFDPGFKCVVADDGGGGDWKYFPTGRRSLLPVSGLVDGVPQRGGARPELVGVRAVGTLQVAA